MIQCLFLIRIKDLKIEVFQRISDVIFMAIKEHYINVQQ